MRLGRAPVPVPVPSVPVRRGGRGRWLPCLASPGSRGGGRRGLGDGPAATDGPARAGPASIAVAKNRAEIGPLAGRCGEGGPLYIAPEPGARKLRHITWARGTRQELPG